MHIYCMEPRRLAGVFKGLRILMCVLLPHVGEALGCDVWQEFAVLAAMLGTVCGCHRERMGVVQVQVGVQSECRKRRRTLPDL